MADDDLLDAVPTKAALMSSNKSAEFKATIFTDRKHKSQSTDDEHGTSSTRARGVGNGRGELEGTAWKPKRDSNEFDIKRARHEVMNFALSGFRTKNKKKSEVVQAIKLGAKPAKKAYKNYKDLLAERKRLKETREDRIKFHQLGKNQTGLAAVKCRAKFAKAAAKKQTKLPIDGISKHYGVANPKLQKRKK